MLRQLEDCIEKELEYYELNLVKHDHLLPQTKTTKSSQPIVAG